MSDTERGQVGTTAAEDFGADVIFLEPGTPDTVPEAQTNFLEPIVPGDSQLDTAPLEEEPLDENSEIPTADEPSEAPDALSPPDACP